MDILKWRQSYETGVEEMDEQHKKLIDLINTMYRVMRGKHEASAVDGVLEEMAEYAGVHFKAEEAMLKSLDFKEYQDHVALHQEYQLRMEELMAEHSREPEKAEKNIYTFLRKWWLEHIVQEDTLYGKGRAAG